jgi:hypothetical protein
MVSLQVLNPVAQSDGKNRFHAARRVLDLHGKQIGLYDNGKSGGAVAQQRLIERLGARFQGNVQRYSGSVGGRKLTAQGAQTIAKDCDAVIGIRGD